jgi:nicotinamidase-related amidase
VNIYQVRGRVFGERAALDPARAGIGNLVFFGITTSGIVLSTLRRAFDLDYRCVVAQGRVH